MTLTLTCHPVKMCVLRKYIHMSYIKLLSEIGENKVARFLPSIWPLPLKDDLNLTLLPIKMCVVMRFIHMPYIKLLSLIAQKLWPIIKLDANKQSNQQTNYQTNQPTDRAKTICPQYRLWDIKVNNRSVPTEFNIVSRNSK